jgi:16S rRNA (adenine1518-N6/adenine1519-N6)-dimethyltransferase
MVPKSDPPALDPQRLSTLVTVAFSQRRKLLRHTLGRWLDEQGYAGEFDLQRRAEEVPVEQYVELALIRPR